MENEGFGKAKFTTGGFKKPFKLEEGDNIYRFVPPIKSCRATGAWAVYHAVHFGYAGVNARDPGKPTQRPFACIQEKDYRTGMIKVECPECENRNVWLAKQKMLEAQGISEGKSKEDIKASLEPINDWLRAHNVDKKFYLNAMNRDGEFNILKLSYKTKKKLDEKIKHLQAEDPNLDITDPDAGIWINIQRTGKMIATEDTPDACYESVQLPSGVRARVMKLAPLSDDQRRQALACADLNDVVTRLSAKQIQMLVECSTDPEDVDRIFALSSPRAEESPARTAAATVPTSFANTPTPTATAAAMAAGKVAPLSQQPSTPLPPAIAAANVPTVIDAEEAQALAALAAIRAKKNAPQVVPAPSEENDLLKMDNSEFAKRFPPPALRG